VNQLDPNSAAKSRQAVRKLTRSSSWARQSPQRSPALQLHCCYSPTGFSHLCLDTTDIRALACEDPSTHIPFDVLQTEDIAHTHTCMHTHKHALAFWNLSIKDVNRPDVACGQIRPGPKPSPARAAGPAATSSSSSSSSPPPPPPLLEMYSRFCSLDFATVRCQTDGLGCVSHTSDMPYLSIYLSIYLYIYIYIYIYIYVYIYIIWIGR
jgi:hypothetical protein